MNILLFRLIKWGFFNKPLLHTFLFGLLLFIPIFIFTSTVHLSWLDTLNMIFVIWFSLINIFSSWNTAIKQIKNQICFMDLFKPTMIKSFSVRQLYSNIFEINKITAGVKILELNKIAEFYSSWLMDYKRDYIVVYDSIEDLTYFMMTVEF